MELTEFEQVLDRFAEDLNNSAKRVLGSVRLEGTAPGVSSGPCKSPSRTL